MSPKGGGASERAEGRPGVILRPLDPGSIVNPSRDLGPQPANIYLGTSDTKYFDLGRRRGPEGPKCHLKGGCE